MDDKLNLKDGGIWIMDSIEKDLKRIYDHYRSVVNENKYLRKENERIKSEKYQDEELSTMKERYDKMKSDYYRGFPISEKESERIKDWINNLTKDEAKDEVLTKIGAIGGRFTYRFTPTSIGVIGTIEDSITGEKLTFQELD